MFIALAGSGSSALACSVVPSNDLNYWLDGTSAQRKSLEEQSARIDEAKNELVFPQSKYRLSLFGLLDDLWDYESQITIANLVQSAAFKTSMPIEMSFYGSSPLKIKLDDMVVDVDMSENIYEKIQYPTKYQTYSRLFSHIYFNVLRKYFSDIISLWEGSKFSIDSVIQLPCFDSSEIYKHSIRISDLSFSFYAILSRKASNGYITLEIESGDDGKVDVWLQDGKVQFVNQISDLFFVEATSDRTVGRAILMKLTGKLGRMQKKYNIVSPATLQSVGQPVEW